MYPAFKSAMIKKFRPYFRKYGRRSRALAKMKRKGYFTSNALSKPTNEFSRVARSSNIPTSCVSRIKAAMTVFAPNITQAAPYAWRLIRGNFPIRPDVFNAPYEPNNVSRYSDYY